MSVLITGANGGLGTAVCQAFLDAGAKALGVAREWPGATPFPGFAADLSTSQGCDAMVNNALEHGPIDALVHLVGGFAAGDLAGTSDETWDAMMNLNLRTAFFTIRAVFRPMAAAGRGRIVAVGARAALEPAPALLAYAVSKSALVALIKNIAADTPKTGVTANIVLPSVIDTQANRKAMPKADFSRWVRPESIAKLLLGLALDPAGDVSGAVIPIYGRA